MTSYGNIKGKNFINYPNYYEWVLRYDNSILVSDEINEEFNILNEKLIEKRYLTEENETKLYEILKNGFYPSSKRNQKNITEYINWKKAIQKISIIQKTNYFFIKKIIRMLHKRLEND